MNPKAESSELNDLLRAVRARVSVDAAELLAQEDPQRIESVLRALPQDLALRIAFHICRKHFVRPISRLPASTFLSPAKSVN
ncbi:MAG: hypothetical protein FJ403_12945 [Verrucomicrobia bacterium]|nr:hypothetical protein [Verrucomicrobiota bacterium]